MTPPSAPAPHGAAPATSASPAVTHPWKQRARRTLVDDRWVTLHADTCELPGGLVLDPFYVLEEKDWVHAVAVDDDGAVLVVRQYRYGAGVTSTEVPGGIVDPGEAPLDAARRELLEETGYTAAEWTPVVVLYANPARQTNRVHCFLARGLTRVAAQSLDHSEEMAVELVAPAEIRRRILHGDFLQSLHVSSYLLAMEHLATLPPLPAQSPVRDSG